MLKIINAHSSILYYDVALSIATKLLQEHLNLPFLLPNLNREWYDHMEFFIAFLSVIIAVEFNKTTLDFSILLEDYKTCNPGFRVNVNFEDFRSFYGQVYSSLNDLVPEWFVGVENKQASTFMKPEKLR